MTSAQKAAKEKFKKAIAYRKKTGCTLKQAFAHVYGKKTVGAVKKKAAPKKKAATKKKAVAKKSGSYHKDTKSHNVNIKVMSGIGKLDKNLVDRLNYVQKEIEKIEITRMNFVHYKNDLIKEKGKSYYNRIMKNSKIMLDEYKKHKAELKKLI